MWAVHACLAAGAQVDAQAAFDQQRVAELAERRGRDLLVRIK